MPKKPVKEELLVEEPELVEVETEKEVTMEEAMAEAASMIVQETPNLQDTVDALKEENPESDLFLSTIGSDTYIFKSLDRVTYNDFRTKSEGMVDPGMIEELVCDMCVLHPGPQNFEILKERQGGLITALSEEIYKVSGFAVVLPPVKL